MKNPHRKFLLPLAIVLTGGLQATTLEWDTSGAPGIQGGNGNWDGAATWTPDAGSSIISWNNATHSAHSAVFSTGTGRVTVNGNISLKGIVASTNETSNVGGRTLSYLIQGAGALNFGTQEGVIDTLASGTRSFQINNNLIGTGGLRMNAANAPATGESWLYLAGDNTGLTGGITIENGMVGVNNPNSLGTNAVVLDGNAGIFGPVNIGGPDTSVINGPASLAISNAVAVIGTGNILRVWGGRTLDLSGNITGAGDISRTDGGTLLISGNTSGYTGTLTNAASATSISGNFGGNLTVSAGNVTLGGNLAGNLTLNGGTTILEGNLAGALAFNQGNLTLNGAHTGDVILTAANSSFTQGSAGKITGNLTTTFHAAGQTLNLGGEITGNTLIEEAVRANLTGTVIGGTLEAGFDSSSETSIKLNVAPPSVAGDFRVHGISNLLLDSSFASGSPVITFGSLVTDTPGNPAAHVLPKMAPSFKDLAFTFNPGNIVVTYNFEPTASVWSGAADSNWTTPGNWNGDWVPTSAEHVVFDNTASNFTVALNALASPASVTFNNTTDYTLTAAAGLGFGGDTGLVKNGTGQVSLGGIGSTYSGDVQVNAGTLRLTSWESLGANGKTINIASGGMVNLNGARPSEAGRQYSWNIAGDGVGGGGAITNTGDAVFSNAGILNLTLSGNASLGGTGRFDIGRSGGNSGTIDGGGFTLTKNGTNEVVVRGPASNITYQLNSGIFRFEDSDAASGTNTITVNGGTLATWGTRTIGNNVNFTTAGATLQSDNNVGTWNGNISLNGNVTFAANNRLVINGTVSGTGDITKTGGNVLQIGSGGTTGSIGNRNLAISGGRVEINRSDAVTLGGNITGTGGLWTMGAGTTTLTGNNTWGGNTRVLGGGVLEVTTVADAGGTGALGAPTTPGTGWLRVGGGSTLRITGPGDQTSNRLIWNDAGSSPDTGLGIFHVVDATASVSFTNTGGGITQPLEKRGAGSLSFARQITGAATVTVDGGTLILNGANTYTGATTIGSGATLRFGSDSNQTLNASFSGSGTLLKAGSGTLTLGAANLHSGETRIEAGTLTLGLPSLADGATLRVTDGAVLNLPHGQTDTIAALWFDGVQLANGTYNAGNTTFITGSGELLVDGSAVSPFDQWLIDAGLTPGAPGTGAGESADGSGVTNLVQFALGGNPADPTDHGIQAVFQRDAAENKELVLTIAVRTGATFAGSPTPTATLDGISYSIEGGQELASWNSNVEEITLTNPGAALVAPIGYTLKSFRLIAASGLPDKGFLRVSISQP